MSERIFNLAAEIAEMIEKEIASSVEEQIAGMRSRNASMEQDLIEMRTRQDDALGSNLQLRHRLTQIAAIADEAKSFLSVERAALAIRAKAYDTYKLVMTESMSLEYARAALLGGQGESNLE